MDDRVNLLGKQMFLGDHKEYSSCNSEFLSWIVLNDELKDSGLRIDHENDAFPSDMSTMNHFLNYYLPTYKSDAIPWIRHSFGIDLFHRQHYVTICLSLIGSEGRVNNVVSTQGLLLGSTK